MIRSGHQALVLCAMPHREHVPGLMHRDFQSTVEEKIPVDQFSTFFFQSPQRPHADAPLQARLTKNIMPRFFRIEVIVRKTDKRGGVIWQQLRKDVIDEIARSDLPVVWKQDP